jgi:hypothetical protein
MKDKQKIGSGNLVSQYSMPCFVVIVRFCFSFAYPEGMKAILVFLPGVTDAEHTT